MANEKLNGYTLTRAWFDYTFEHPEKFNPTDGYLYLFLIEIANRSGWSDKFDVSAKDIMQALGIGTYNTYKKSFDKLVSDGWIKVVKKSTNQFQKTVIALSKSNVATNGALDRALYIACDEATNEALSKADTTIIKTVNLKPKTKGISIPQKKDSVLVMPDDVEPEVWERYLNLNNWIKDNAQNILKIERQITLNEYQKLASKMKGTELASLLIKMHNWKGIEKRNVSVYLTVLDWAKRGKKATEIKVKQPKVNVFGFDPSRMAP